MVRGCDEIFKERNATASDYSVMVVKPSVDIWRKLVDRLVSAKGGISGN